MTTDTLVSSARAAELAGVTYRQLDHWDRTGFIRPASAALGSGTQRGYDEVDVQRLTIARRMLDLGFQLDRIRAALACADRGVLQAMPADTAHLVMTESDTWVASTRRAALAVAADATGSVAVVDASRPEVGA